MLFWDLRGKCFTAGDVDRLPKSILFVMKYGQMTTLSSVTYDYSKHRKGKSNKLDTFLSEWFNLLGLVSLFKSSVIMLISMWESQIIQIRSPELIRSSTEWERQDLSIHFCCFISDLACTILCKTRIFKVKRPIRRFWLALFIIWAPRDRLISS